ncbi:uncharacterized protein LOC109118182 isoform X2 [Fukomys damarensis]|uniref:uncharacterized protein LOC109118182 isoform X2 n=1 Tax=Fukomys damarensis TaxID=885580 RepID=UPI001455D476|nr:uncharacterized protein LOC109118182 isoform X2 [Fukomys damarensis]
MKVQIKDLRGGEPQTAAEATPRNQSRAWERGARDRCVPGGEEEGMDDPLARMGTPKGVRRPVVPGAPAEPGSPCSGRSGHPRRGSFLPPPKTASQRRSPRNVPAW